MSILIENTLNEVRAAGGIYTAMPIVSTGTVVTLPATTTIGGSSVSALGVITSASANALSVGLNGSTNPAFNVDSSTGSQAAGLNVVGATAAGTVAVAAISSGGAAGLSIDSKGTALLTLQGTATGNVVIGHGLTATTATLTGAGAVGLTTLVTKIVTTGANALTLADGVDGQMKILVMTTDGGDGTLTPTTKTGFTTIVFNDAGDGCALVFTTTTGWIVYSNFGCTIS